MKANTVELAILTMLKEAVQRGDVAEFLAMGWTEDDIKAVNEIGITDLAVAGRLPKGRLYKAVRPNREWIEQYRAQSASERRRSDLAESLVSYRASYGVTNNLLGISKRRWRTTRLVCDARLPNGRSAYRSVSTRQDVETIVSLFNDFNLHMEPDDKAESLDAAAAVVFVTEHLGYHVNEVHRVWCQASEVGDVRWW